MESMEKVLRRWIFFLGGLVLFVLMLFFPAVHSRATQSSAEPQKPRRVHENFG